MGYIRGVIHGLVIGAAVGLCIAPQEGTKTREQLRDAAEKVRGGLDSAQETARRVAPQVREVVETATGVVASLRERVGGHDDSVDGIELSGGPAPTETAALQSHGVPI